MTLPTAAVDAGSAAELIQSGRLLTKIGGLPVLVVSDAGDLFAIEDRCPHLGFPLHQGTVEAGMVTCHWHHARFDLVSGCTLDPWADDAMGFDVAEQNGRIIVSARPQQPARERHVARLRAGIEQQITIVMAKAVLGLCELDDEETVLRTVFEFGLRNDGRGWGAGLTTAACLARSLPHLDQSDRPQALIHACVAVANDAAGQSPRFELGGLPNLGQPADRLLGWYRRFAETRSSDGAERSLATALGTEDSTLERIEQVMFATLTDHVFVDVGHTLDFTNKMFEALTWIDPDMRSAAITSLVTQTCVAGRSEELGEWNHPHDLATLATHGGDVLAAATSAQPADAAGLDEHALYTLASRLLDVEPNTIPDALADSGATLEQLARTVALAAALRECRFHTSNDVADWNTVHHTMSFANAVHAAIRRYPSADIARGVVHAALRVHLDRFLNVPATRLRDVPDASLDRLTECWGVQGAVDRAGSLVWSLVRAGHQAEVVAALGHAVLQEDAGFHQYQAFEAAVTQAACWRPGSEAAAAILAGFARFLAAYTPTRRELTTTIRTAIRLRRGEDLTADED